MGLWVWALALGGAAAGCGGSGGQSAPPSCLQVQPCGGDVVGRWSFLGACENLAAENSQLMGSCPGASLSALGLSLTGILTFNADMTYTASNWHESFAGIETEPLMCASAATCAAGNMTTTDNGTPGLTSTITAACTGTSTCVCRVAGNISITADSGPYSLAGTTIDLSGSAIQSSFDYCVEENQLHLMRLSTVGVPAGASVTISDIVAQRL